MRSATVLLVGLLACDSGPGQEPGPSEPPPVSPPSQSVPSPDLLRLVDAELARDGLDRTDRLGIAGPARRVRAAEVRFLPYGTPERQAGQVSLGVAPEPGRTPAVEVLLSTGYGVTVSSGAASITERPSREELRDAVALAVGAEGPALRAAVDRLAELPIDRPAGLAAWDAAHVMTRLDVSLRSFSFFFSPTGQANVVEGRLMVAVNADSRAIEVLGGLDVVTVARGVLARAGHDVSRAELVAINPGYGRPLPVGITSDMLLSHWVVRATGVPGRTHPLWVPLAKHTFVPGPIVEAADPAP